MAYTENIYFQLRFLFVSFAAPEFVTRLNAFVEVTAGTNVVFACQWKSLVKPSVKWYKDDQEVTEDERYKVVALEDGVENLLIEDPRRADEGTYKCKAENHEGVASTTGYLSVTGILDLSFSLYFLSVLFSCNCTYVHIVLHVNRRMGT